MKRIIFFVILCCFIVVGYVIFQKQQKRTVPSNLPTADEMHRIEEIEKTSSEIAPNAVPGAGVRPVGSLPKPTPQPESTSTIVSTTTSTTSVERE